MLTIQNLSTGYQNIQIIKDISFRVQEGEKLCILGANGCGKTTLLRAVAGLLPIQGKILLQGQDMATISRKDIAKKIAVMSQVTNLSFDFTVYETVMMGRYPHRKDRIFSSFAAQDKQIVQQSLMQVDMWDQRDSSITKLSGGQLQRVLLARTFAQTPNIILLDEPTNHLDFKYQLELMDILTQWAKQPQRCVVGVLHDINLALSFADSVLLLKDGRILCKEPTEQLCLSKLSEIYQTDVPRYMKKLLKIWEEKP